MCHLSVFNSMFMHWNEFGIRIIIRLVIREIHSTLLLPRRSVTPLEDLLQKLPDRQLVTKAAF